MTGNHGMNPLIEAGLQPDPDKPRPTITNPFDDPYTVEYALAAASYPAPRHIDHRIANLKSQLERERAERKQLERKLAECHARNVNLQQSLLLALHRLVYLEGDIPGWQQAYTLAAGQPTVTTRALSAHNREAIRNAITAILLREGPLTLTMLQTRLAGPGKRYQPDSIKQSLDGWERIRTITDGDNAVAYWLTGKAIPTEDDDGTMPGSVGLINSRGKRTASEFVPVRSTPKDQSA